MTSRFNVNQQSFKENDYRENIPPGGSSSGGDDSGMYEEALDSKARNDEEVPLELRQERPDATSNVGPISSGQQDAARLVLGVKSFTNTFDSEEELGMATAVVAEQIDGSTYLGPAFHSDDINTETTLQQERNNEKILMKSRRFKLLLFAIAAAFICVLAIVLAVVFTRLGTQKEKWTSPPSMAPTFFFNRLLHLPLEFARGTKIQIHANAFIGMHHTEASIHGVGMIINKLPLCPIGSHLMARGAFFPIPLVILYPIGSHGMVKM